MPPNVAYLEGGPCNGTTRTGFDEVNPPPTFTCKGNEYDYWPGHARPNGDLIYRYQPPPDTSGGGAVGPHAHGGWGDVRHSINHNMPAALNQAHRSAAAALRSLGRARKVRL